MVFGNHAPSLRRGEKRNAGRFNKLPQFCCGAGPEDAATGNEEWALGFGKEINCTFDERGIPRRARIDPIIRRPIELFIVNFGGEDIAGKIKIDWAFLPIHRFAEGETDVFGNSRGNIDTIRRFHHRLHHCDLIHLLKGIQHRCAHRG